jgi:hypothetical protein
MGRKERTKWENTRRDLYDRMHCPFDGCERMMWRFHNRDDKPIACALNTIENLQPLPPPYGEIHHRLLLNFVGEHECDVDCGVVKRKEYSSNYGGMSIYKRIKEVLNIEDIAEQITTLYGSNTTLTGPCPFHNGSGRELVIWTEIQEWKCLGRCQTGGDVIDMIFQCDKEAIEWTKPKIVNDLRT